MNYNISKKTKNLFKKATKGLIVFCTFSFISYHSYAQVLPHCNTLASGVDAQPGANCLYFDLPICTDNPYANSTISSPEPRINCADLIDMPLCSDVSAAGGTPDDKKNCVTECVHVPEDASQVRGVDYARHGIDCIRFAGNSLSNGDPNPENLPTNFETLVPDATQRHTTKKCHQSVEGDLENGNCELLSCDLLTLDELKSNHDTTFQDDTKHFCDGSNVKCHTINQDKLEFFIPRNNHTMCIPHICQPLPKVASEHCSDETQDVIDKGNDYVKAYQEHILGIDTPVDLDSTDDNTAVKEKFALGCTTPAVENLCKPIINRQYYCSEDDPPIPHVDCETSCNTDNICTKAIDCNIPGTTEPECALPASGEEGDGDTWNEPRKEWFFYPKPMDKATNSIGELHQNMNKEKLCYSMSDLDDNNWGWDSRKKVGPIVLDLGYFHSQGLPDKTRSPGKCNAKFDGFRGTGYNYLCGNDNNINAKVSSYTAYHKSYNTVFTDTDIETTLDVCLRFKNSTMPKSSPGSETCGRRECAIACAFDVCTSQLCGFDKCKTLVVRESEADKCMFNENMFRDTNKSINGVETECLDTIDTGLRLRAVQYGNKICTFLDSKGQFAYNKMFMRGNEKLSDGTCLGEKNSKGDCDGKNSNDGETLADKYWRAVMRIPFIQHHSKIENHPNFQGARGYLDQNNHLVQEQECIHVPLRIRTPKLYNLATKNNSSRLFRPPLVISQSYIQKGGNPSSINGELGPTDFNYPEIDVKFGDSTVKKLSLTLGEIDGRDEESQGLASITTTFQGIIYDTTIFIKKEYNHTTKEPSLCLYETVTDSEGLERNFRRQCIKRRLPEINGSLELESLKRKVIITDPGTANTYDNFDISLKYEANNQTDGLNSSQEIILGNAVQDVPECDANTEKYQICAQREECTKLTNEYVKNEIAIQNSAPNDDISPLLAIRRDYDSNLAKKCDKKQGIVDGTTYSNAYGWFNELCISSGFESKLKNVVAHKVDDPSIMGKCVIDTTKSTGTCTNGGKPAENGSAMGDCICLQQDSLDSFDPLSHYIRKQTPREAGLCIDIPVAQLCSGTLYDHATDADRTAATIVGNADFTTPAFGGMNNIEGSCKGNWTYQKDPSTGGDLKPKMNCATDTNGNAYWDTASLQNPCVRYSCNAVISEPRLHAGAVTYTNSYADVSETQDYDPSTLSNNMGDSQGYALWNETTSSDSNVIATAHSCLPGFEAIGGILPTRECSPQGHWQHATLTNKCVRKTCSRANFVTDSINFDASNWETTTEWTNAWAVSSINPVNHTPGSTGWHRVWSNWAQFGGAMFAAGPASRMTTTADTDDVPAGSIIEGTCNKAIGYFQGGVYKPQLKCKSDGTWATDDIKNPCVTNCDTIDINSPQNDNNGNAYWTATTADAGQVSDGQFNGCIAGYVPYPYSPPQDKTGAEINFTLDPDDSSKKLLANNTAPTNPKRLCHGINVGSDDDDNASYWGTAYPACINTCPGAATDSRVGVGITKHKLANGTYEYIEWPDNITPGNSHTIYSSDALQHVKQYGDPNSNYGTYAVKRECGADYKWKTYTITVDGQTVIEDVLPQCSKRDHGGNNDSEDINASKARFGVSSSDTVDEGIWGTWITANRCITGYGNQNDNMPQYECVAKDNNRHIDQFYYKQKSGSPTCTKTCKATYNHYYPESHSNSRYTGSTQDFFPGEEVDLACRSGYGHALGTPSACDSDGICNGGVYQCGRKVNNTDNSRIAQNPTMTCQSDGSWVVANACSACQSCTCTSDTCGSKPYPYIASVDTPGQKVSYCTRADNDGSTNDDIFISGPYDKNDVSCGDGKDKKRGIYPGTVSSGLSFTTTENGSDNGDSVTWRFNCYDGLFTIDQIGVTGDTGVLQTKDQ